MQPILVSLGVLFFPEMTFEGTQHIEPLRVRFVLAGSTASAAGVKAGDVIVAVDDVAVNTSEELSASLSGERTCLRLRVRRLMKIHTSPCVIGKVRPDAALALEMAESEAPIVEVLGAVRRRVVFRRSQFRAGPALLFAEVTPKSPRFCVFWHFGPSWCTTSAAEIDDELSKHPGSVKLEVSDEGGGYGHPCFLQEVAISDVSLKAAVNEGTRAAEAVLQAKSGSHAVVVLGDRVSSLCLLVTNIDNGCITLSGTGGLSTKCLSD